MADVIVTTMNDLPGHRVAEVKGEVFGLTVRSRHIGSDTGASLKGLVGGGSRGYTKMLSDSGLQAVERLRLNRGRASPGARPRPARAFAALERSLSRASARP